MALAPITATEVDLLRQAAAASRKLPPHREILSEGTVIREPSILISGWACRVRHFTDGRRQILNLVLPGDLIGFCHHREPLAATSIISINHVTTCPAPDASGSANLAEAYAISGALEEFYLFRQIARLGRLSAYERVIDWLLETEDRLALAGLTDGDRFPMPLTQELVADVLGLTSVHVNRTAQTLRREGVLNLGNGSASLSDRKRLALLVDYRAARVTAH